MKTIKKNIILIFLMVSVLIISNSLIVNAGALNDNIETVLKDCEKIIDDFDFYQIRSPEEIREVGNKFKNISDELIDSQNNNEELNTLILNAYESLTEFHIDMEQVHESFQDIQRYSEIYKKQENIDETYVYKHKVVEKIKEMYGEENDIIQGYIHNKDRQNNYLTRAELGTIIYRTIDKSLVANELSKKVIIPNLNKHWSKEYLSNEYMVSILNLEENTNLDEYISKKEILQIVSKLN